MKKIYTLIIGLLCIGTTKAQFSELSGIILDADQNPVEFANVVLYQQADSSLYKVETTNEDGAFLILNVIEGTYYLEATIIGYNPLVIGDIVTIPDQNFAFGTLKMETSSIELETAVVTAQRALVEIKPDRTVFNVQGTINSAGDDGLSLLRKAPGVLVDNNDNISVLSRSGVLIYVDGKRLPLQGSDLSNYLKNLPAEQIDRIDIITNPGARYEAQGNAGIIDIRMKKNENYGTNGSISSTLSQGRYARGNVNSTGNFRNKLLNSYGTLGYSKGDNFNEMNFKNFQNGLLLDETNFMRHQNENYNYRWGTDFFLNDKSTIGFLISGNSSEGNHFSNNRNLISQESGQVIDSVLIANNSSTREGKQWTYNLNYAYRNKNTTLNLDADYGRFRNDASFLQPNRYFNANETELMTEIITTFNTPVEIDIYTFKVDYEKDLLGGRFGIGSKLSKVSTDNTFLFSDIIDDAEELNKRRSNQFLYDEKVYAGYISYNRALSEKWKFTGGLRLEQTEVTGDLVAFLPELQQDPIKQSYLNAFPSLGFTYQSSPMHMWSINYGRRINRPDYKVLNPFREQLSELSFSKGNAFLRPEIVNNAEIGYTLNYRYNFKIAYSKTTDQITRLIGPDEEDPRAGFITWDNLAEQTVIGLNVSAPVTVTKAWNAFFNLSGSHIDNQADYGDGAVVDVQAWTYSIYQQHTFKLPGKFSGEISGWFSGPGVWGGVFLYETSWSLNLGLQRKFFNDQMNVRLSANDIFYQSGWEGVSVFNGLRGEGNGNWDSRRVSLSVSMNLGNSKVKSRKRKTGIEDEAGRVSNQD